MSEEQVYEMLRHFLERSGTQWERRGGLVRFRLRREGMVWETECRCMAGGLLIYGRYPFEGEREKRERVCSRINARLTHGALFVLENGHAVYRNRAALEDPFGAQERLQAALEQNAAVITRFWGELSLI